MATKRRHWILTASILVSASGCGLTLGEHGHDGTAASEVRPAAGASPKYVEATVEFCLPPDLPDEFEPTSSQGISSYRPISRTSSAHSIMLVQATEPVAPSPAPATQLPPSTPAPLASISQEPVKKAGTVRAASAQGIYVAGSAPSQGEAAAPQAQVACARPTAWGRCRQKVHDCIAGYYADFSYTQLGQYLYDHGRTMVANGDASRMVLYDYDFIEGGAALNNRGKDQLAKIQTMLPRNFFPLVVERTPDAPKLAQARRQQVLKELAKSTFPIPPERVVIGQSTADGLRGVEAVIIHQNLITQTQNGGQTNLNSLLGSTGNSSQSTAGQAAPTSGSPQGQ